MPTRVGIGSASFSLAAGVLLAIAHTGGVAAAGVSVDGGPAVPEAVLFSFDDHGIPWRDNVAVTMVTATKHPDNPVLRRGPKGAPDHGHAILYGTVLFIDGKFRMWYLGMFETELAAGQAPGWWRPMCYAESDDGVHWVKPSLGLVEFNGGRDNNICKIESEVPSLAKVNDFLSVLHEPDHPDPNQRYKCVYIAHPPFTDIRGGRSGIGPDERRWAAFVAAASADGLNWKVVGDRPRNAGGERFEVTGLYRFGDFYYAPGQLISPWTWRLDGSDIGRAMLTYRSSDFVNWSRAKALAFARPGQWTAPPIVGQQTHMGAGLWNRGNVVVGLHGMWQDPKEKSKDPEQWNAGVAIDLGLILSNNGVHFREPVPDHKVIARGAKGAWDDIALLQGHAFVNRGDETMLWYSHWDTGAGMKSMEIGLATLRRDGFGYLTRRVAGSPAHILTAGLRASGQSKVHINADGLNERQPIRVELLDAKDRVVPGFGGADAAVVTVDGVRRPVRWAKPIPAGMAFALRIHLPDTPDARLFAVYVTDH